METATIESQIRELALIMAQQAASLAHGSSWEHPLTIADTLQSNAEELLELVRGSER